MIWNKFLILIFKLKIFKNNLDISRIENVVLVKHDLRKFGLKDFYHAGISVLQVGGFEKILFSGLDQSAFVSLDKAISEYFEAQTIGDLELKLNNRNGVAVHVTKELSFQKAFEELIERDSFLMHFFLPSLKNELLLEFKDNDTEWYFFKLQTIDPSVAVVLSVKKKLKSAECYLGLSSKINCKDLTFLIQCAAQESTMLESTWVVPRFYYGDRSRAKETLLMNHLKSINSYSTNQWLQKMLSNSSQRKVEYALNCDQLELEINNHVIKNRFFTKLNSKYILPLYFGASFELNRDLYEEILKSRGMRIENWSIHPLL